ncbi:hypothetical protein ACOMHN_008043 [Nucella lapillus]
MAESAFFPQHEKYDYLQFVIPDFKCIPRGKIISGKFKEKVARKGFEVANAICCQPGPSVELEGSDALFHLLGYHIPNENMRPCLETLTPWPWVGKEGRRVGNVLCDLVMHDGTPDLTSPRQLMKAQLDALWEQHGLVLKSAFEYEFVVYNMATSEPLGEKDVGCWDVRAWGEHEEVFSELSDVLKCMGVEVESLMAEIDPGQWELTTEPEEGVRGGDVAFYVKNAVKGVLQKRGYRATFMSKPCVRQVGTDLHLNHSLWSKTGGELRCATREASDGERLSVTARHWLTGILAHAPALTALCCPTLNCYRRLHGTITPSAIQWGVDSRRVLVRVRNAHDNVFLENRLSSGACNPYLAIAATVAAGLDGLNRRLACPRPLEGKAEVPRTLAQALDALEKDEELRALLGDRFVKCFVTSKREGDLALFDAKALDTEEKQMEFEINLYMKDL